MSAAPQIVLVPPTKRRPQPLRKALRWLATLAAAALVLWGAVRAYQALTSTAAAAIPVAQVKRGDLRFTVYAQGTLAGGHSEILTAPMINGDALSIRSLAETGTLVAAGATVAAFDTSAQEYNLKQAQAALAQAQQQVIAARATASAQADDDAYQLKKAQFDLDRAQLQVRKNPIRAAVDAQKASLALAAAREHLRQLQQDVASRAANNQASIALQQATERKAQSDASTAQSNIAAMTLRATHAGYVSVRENMRNGFNGLAVPLFQVGDIADPGLAIAEIPDTSSWELDVTVSEFDRGHLAAGQSATAEFAPLPGQSFPARLRSVGGATGPAWNRQVHVVLDLIRASPALKPGLTAKVNIVTQTLSQVLFIPSQAVFGPDGANYVYLRSGSGFARHPIQVLSRSESQVVLNGLSPGDTIALANPEQANSPSTPAAATPAAAGGGAQMIAVPR